MSEEIPSSVQHLWAPWRMEYIRALVESPPKSGCFLCDYWIHPERDGENLVVARVGSTIAVLNRYPYTAGHLLIADSSHCAKLQGLSDDALAGLMRMTRRMAETLETVLHAQGLNIGINQGAASGAGVPDHLHVHIVPRWGGDTNYMSVLADVRVVNDSLTAVYQQLRAHA